MNIFYYLDALSSYNIAFYQIETDLSLDQLKKFINDKAIEYANEIELDTNDFLNKKYDYDFIIKIGNIDYYFSLSTGLSMYYLDHRLIKELNPTKIIKFNTEEII